MIGSWSFSFFESGLFLLFYSLLIAINLASLSIEQLRVGTAGTSGTFHLLIGGFHLYRLFNPVTFEVFDHPWPRSASVREVVIVVPFGLLSLFVMGKLRRSTL